MAPRHAPSASALAWYGSDAEQRLQGQDLKRMAEETENMTMVNFAVISMITPEDTNWSGKYPHKTVLGNCKMTPVLQVTER